MTKEEQKEYDRKYYQANKEKRVAQNKAWNLKNKEKVAALRKAWNKANKEKVDVYNKAYREANKDGLFTVYLIVNENYVGQTKCLYQRLKTHKNTNGRDVSNVQILGKYETKREALDVEASYHSIGFNGRHPNYNK